MFQWPKFLQIHTGIAFFPEVYNHHYIYMFHVPMFLRLRLFLSEVFIHWYIYMFQWPLTQQISCSRGLSRCPRSSSDKPLYVYTAL